MLHSYLWMDIHSICRVLCLKNGKRFAVPSPSFERNKQSFCEIDCLKKKCFYRTFQRYEGNIVC